MVLGDRAGRQQTLPCLARKDNIRKSCLTFSISPQQARGLAEQIQRSRGGHCCCMAPTHLPLAFLFFQLAISIVAAFGMTHTTTHSDGTITLTPRNEADQSAAVVICHGLGDTSAGFEDVAGHLSSSFPHVKFILPTAPTQKVTMNMGMPMREFRRVKGPRKQTNDQRKLSGNAERFL